MIVGLLIGKERSTGVPGKNIKSIVGRPMAEYGLIAARAVPVDHMFVSTDSAVIAEIGARYCAQIIERPAELATPEALTEDVLVHAGMEITKHLGVLPSIVVLLFANCPAIDVRLIREGIEILQTDQTIDSAFSVCQYNMFTPNRARRLSDDGLIESFVPLEMLGDNLSSIRGSQGDAYFCDLSVQVLRWRCLEKMDEGLQPFQWMGRRSKALLNDYGFDVDSNWQFDVVERWLRARGFSEDRMPYDVGDPESWR